MAHAQGSANIAAVEPNSGVTVGAGGGAGAGIGIDEIALVGGGLLVFAFVYKWMWDNSWLGKPLNALGELATKKIQSVN